MPGILANSATHTMVSTSADQAEAGYLTAEQVTLSVTPTATSWAWAVARPNGSSAARSALSEDDVASPTFTPDVAGYYVVTCTVNGTTSYVLRINVTSVATLSPAQGLRLSPVTDAQVEAPAVGIVLFCGADHSNVLCVKYANDVVHVVTVV